MNLLKAFCPTVEQTSYIVLHMFICAGFIPFDIDCSNLKVKRSHRHNPFTFKWIILMCLFYTVETAIAIAYHDSVFFSDFAVGWINDMLKYGSEVLAIYVTLMEILAQRNEQLEIFERLTQFGLGNSGVGLLSAMEFTQFFKKYLIKIFVYLGVTLTMELKILFGVMQYNSQWAKIWTLEIFVLSFGRLRSLFYMFYIDLIRAELEILRRRLLTLKDTMKWVKAFASDSHQYKITVEETANSLINLKKCYSDIWHINTNVNISLGWSICFNLVSNFIQVSCDLYWLYLALYDKVSDGYTELILCLSPATILIVTLLYSAESCLEVANSLGPLLHEIPKNGRVDLYKIIYRLSNHISQQPIRFAAHSLFDVNYKLLKMFITGVATYMFIFIPFSLDLPENPVNDAQMQNAADHDAINHGSAVEKCIHRAKVQLAVDFNTSQVFGGESSVEESVWSDWV